MAEPMQSVDTRRESYVKPRAIFDAHPRTLEMLFSAADLKRLRSLVIMRVAPEITR